VATTDVEHVDGGPLGLLSGFLTVSTTEAGDIDGGPPGGCWRQVRQQPSPMLMMSTVGPLVGDDGMSGSGHHRY
jgi:hypothetical protein